MLLENNFKVTSTDASDKMLKQAWKIRWQHRKEKAFDDWGKRYKVACWCLWDLRQQHIIIVIDWTWTKLNSLFLSVIEEGNWLCLQDANIDVPSQGFDSVICLGNSFAHLPDFQGDLSNQKLSIQNFKDMLKPGGVLFIDHRNYDAILDTGKAPSRNLYYNVSFNAALCKCNRTRLFMVNLSIHALWWKWVLILD